MLALLKAQPDKLTSNIFRSWASDFGTSRPGCSIIAFFICPLQTLLFGQICDSSDAAAYSSSSFSLSFEMSRFVSLFARFMHVFFIGFLPEILSSFVWLYQDWQETLQAKWRIRYVFLSVDERHNLSEKAFDLASISSNSPKRYTIAASAVFSDAQCCKLHWRQGVYQVFDNQKFFMTNMGLAADVYHCFY